MKSFKIVIPFLLLLGIIVGVVAPIGPMPGFFIGGTPAVPPSIWPDTSEEHEIKLMVNAQVPRVVILWVIDYKNELYVLGNSSSGWVQMIGQGAPVKLRLVNSTFNLTAERVTEGLDPIKTAYIEKYRRDYPDIVENLPQEENFRIFHLKRPLI